ncbi:MAG: hypothetical protein CL878_01375 [Dehalococcoidia bacterium]|nr:hypothetical protein [Dehalococcoidia bacterium]
MSGEPGTPAPRRTLPLLMAAMAFALPHEITIAPLLPNIATELDHSVGAIGQLGTAAHLGGLVAALGLAPVIGQLPLRALLAAALACLAAASVLSGLLSAFLALLVVRFLAGMAGGLIAASVLTGVGRAWTDQALRATHTGYVLGAVAIAIGVLAPLLRLLGSMTTWRLAPIVFGVGAGLVALLIGLAAPPLPGVPGAVAYRARLAAAVQATTLPLVRSVLGLRLVAQAVFGLAVGFVAAFFVHLYPGQEAWIAPLFFVLPLGMSVAAIGGGRLLAGLSAGRPLLVATVVAAASLLVFTWLRSAPVVTAAAFCLYGVAFGFLATGVPPLLYEQSGRQRDSVLFLSVSLRPAGSMLGTALGGAAIIIGPGYLGWQVLLTVMLAVLVGAGVAVFRGAAPT